MKLTNKILLAAVMGLSSLGVMAQEEAALMVDSIPSINPKGIYLSNGKMCPEFSLKDFKGKTWTRDDFKGRYLVMDCWATWCSACIAKMPAYVELAKKYAGDERIQFITLSIDSRDAYKQWLYKLPKLGLLDFVNVIAPKSESDFGEKFELNAVPRYLIIGPDGKIVDFDAPSAHDGLAEIIENLLK